MTQNHMEQFWRAAAGHQVVNNMMQWILDIKMRLWNATLDEKRGSSKIIKGDGFNVDRDINGSRNILCKNSLS